MRRSSRALERALAEVEQQQLRRRRLTLEPLDSIAGVRIRGSDQRLTNFSSNDYLGLAREPRLADRMAQCAHAQGAGSGAAHLVSGHGSEHAALEEEIAQFVGRERALLFSTGYMANLAALTTFVGRGDRVLLDRLDHASLIDGALLSGAIFARYTHADADALARRLGTPGETPGTSALVATDGVFSMDGDIAPLGAIARLCRDHEAWLVVDDAHGIGVVGANGRGSLEHAGLSSDDVPILVGTFGKAFGSFGAFVAGDGPVVELVLQRARSYIYTTALPQPVAAATRAALEIARQEPWRRERVLALTARLRSGLAREGLELTASQTPIQPIILGSAGRALAAQSRLQDAGFLVTAIRPPTVPAGSARLRIALSAAHRESDVDALVTALADVLSGLPDTARPLA